MLIVHGLSHKTEHFPNTHFVAAFNHTVTDPAVCVSGVTQATV